MPGVNLTLDVKQCEAVAGGPSEMNPPLREVPHSAPRNLKETYTDKAAYPVNVTSAEVPNSNPESVLTRESDPHKMEHVTRIIQEVTIGPDVTEDQCLVIHELLKEYADCFTLSIKEVNAIPGAVHKLTILEGATF